MDMAHFSRVNAERCQRWHDIDSWSASDWMTALVGEIGEAANIIKKLNRIRDGIKTRETERDKEELMEKLEDELADAYIYLDLLFTAMKIPKEMAIISKFNRTSQEYDFPERLP
jgi:NTP pyrophosphatase (non-canonical NTP hydrolase)